MMTEPDPETWAFVPGDPAVDPEITAWANSVAGFLAARGIDDQPAVIAALETIFWAVVTESIHRGRLTDPMQCLSEAYRLLMAEFAAPSEASPARPATPEPSGAPAATRH